MNEGERTFGWFVLIAVAALWVGIAISRYLEVVSAIETLITIAMRQHEITRMQDDRIDYLHAAQRAIKQRALKP